MLKSGPTIVRVAAIAGGLCSSLLAQAPAPRIDPPMNKKVASPGQVAHLIVGHSWGKLEAGDKRFGRQSSLPGALCDVWAFKVKKKHSYIVRAIAKHKHILGYIGGETGNRVTKLQTAVPYLKNTDALFKASTYTNPKAHEVFLHYKAPKSGTLYVYVISKLKRETTEYRMIVTETDERKKIAESDVREDSFFRPPSR